jgi:hypothetical protein
MKRAMPENRVFERWAKAAELSERLADRRRLDAHPACPGSKAGDSVQLDRDLHE